LNARPNLTRTTHIKSDESRANKTYLLSLRLSGLWLLLFMKKPEHFDNISRAEKDTDTDDVKKPTAVLKSQTRTLSRIT
jgi:hypothetical protein